MFFKNKEDKKIALQAKIENSKTEIKKLKIRFAQLEGLIVEMCNKNKNYTQREKFECLEQERDLIASYYLPQAQKKYQKLLKQRESFKHYNS